MNKRKLAMGLQAKISAAELVHPANAAAGAVSARGGSTRPRPCPWAGLRSLSWLVLEPHHSSCVCGLLRRAGHLDPCERTRASLGDGTAA